MKSVTNSNQTPNLLELAEAFGAHAIMLADRPICGDEATDSPGGPTELSLCADEGPPPTRTSVCADEVLAEKKSISSDD